MHLEMIRYQVMPEALELLPPRMASERAQLMILAIGMQESGFRTRHQVGGSAHSFWQFEQGGGVKGVLKHPLSKPYALNVCALRGVEATPEAVFEAMEEDDILACCMARLLLWTDPAPLPVVGEVAKSWDLYTRVWRPGKAHRERWDNNYAQAMNALRELVS